MDHDIKEPDIPEILKSVGLRVTPQRDAILRHIIDRKGHMSADQIYRFMQGSLPNLSVSTVYNTLKSLSDAGLIREIKFGDGASLFDANREPHHHMVCTVCKELFDFYLLATPDLTQIAQQVHFHIEEYHIQVKGICDACQRRMIDVK